MKHNLYINGKFIGEASDVSHDGIININLDEIPKSKSYTVEAVLDEETAKPIQNHIKYGKTNPGLWDRIKHWFRPKTIIAP
jgi:hypothetical protein